MAPFDLFLYLSQRLTVSMVDNFIADLKDAVKEAKVTPSGEGTMVALYGPLVYLYDVLCYLFPPQVLGNRVPSVRPWLANWRLHSWIHYTRHERRGTDLSG